MKIVLSAMYYHPEVGGMESHEKGLADYFVRAGHVVTVVTSRSQPGLAGREMIDGVEVIRTRFFGKTFAGWLLTTLVSIPALVRAARASRVVHGHDFPAVVAGLAARTLWGVPLVVTIHSSHFLRMVRRPLFRLGYRFLFAGVDHLMAPSRELAAAVRACNSRLAVEVITNAVDTDFFRPVTPALERRARFLILCPRRLVAKNGVEYAVRALPLVRAAVEAELVLVGDGPERASLQALARDLGVDAHVRFLGAQEHERMPGILAAADVVVVPSLMEATSIAALEAMACARAVVASDVGGLPEIVDDRVGMLVPPADPAALARAVRALLGSDRRLLEQAARQRVVEHWSNNVLAARHLALYARLDSARHGAR